MSESERKTGRLTGKQVIVDGRLMCQAEMDDGTITWTDATDWPKPLAFFYTAKDTDDESR